MEKAFGRLPKERQRHILNAALEVFAHSDYKRASTEAIAMKAGISKGLLFYYFKNKQALYEACYSYVEALMMHELRAVQFEGVTDFFELMELGERVKLALVARAPYLMEYSMRVYYAGETEAQRAARKRLDSDLLGGFDKYFGHVDLSKFKPEADPQQVLHMMTWMAEGYLNEKLRQGVPLCLEDMLAEYRSWAQWFRRMSYRQEYV